MNVGISRVRPGKGTMFTISSAYFCFAKPSLINNRHADECRHLSLNITAVSATEVKSLCANRITGFEPVIIMKTVFIT